MKSKTGGVLCWVLSTAIICLWLAGQLELNAQTPSGSCTPYVGDKQVWLTTGTPGTFGSTHDYIDATQLPYSTHDVCEAIKLGLSKLNSSPTSGCPDYLGRGLIDARGVSSNAGTFACSVNPFPAASGSNQTAAYVTVLLPAGIIPITTPWVLPPNTRLIGEGSHAQVVTEIRAGSGFTGITGNALVYMGDQPGVTTKYYCANSDCNGISIEHLALDGGSTTITGLVGILNNYAQELNYVNDVAFTRIAGTGLMIEGVANNSGPYTDIYYSGSGTCVDINGTINTRGLNGIDCVGSASVAAILVDGRNNTIQNVTISGYTGDGIEIGSQASAQSNLLVNISGSTSLADVVHIATSTSGSPTDLTLMGISGSTTGTIINDAVSGSASVKDSTGYIGLYVLGEGMTSGSTPVGYSRFTTAGNTETPAWFQGTVPATGSCASVADGSLYSVTSSVSSGPTLSGCIGGSWVALSGSN
jgi:hypothetical protein